MARLGDWSASRRHSHLRDGDYSWLNDNRVISSNPELLAGAVRLTFHERE
jgi:hypothetical protein